MDSDRVTDWAAKLEAGLGFVHTMCPSNSLLNEAISENCLIDYLIKTIIYVVNTIKENSDITSLSSELTANNNKFYFDFQNDQYGYNTDPCLLYTSNLYQLAQAAGATAQTLSALNAAKGRFGTTGSATYDALRARKDVAIAMLNQEKEADIGFEPVEIDFGGSFAGAKDAAGSAGKEAADEYKEQFEKELSSLQDLHERGKITEKEYLDALRAKIYYPLLQ